MKKGEKTLVVGIRSLEEAGREFIAAWKSADARTSSRPAKKDDADDTPHLYFENIVDLWKQLTPRRMEVVHVLRQQGAMSIRKLSATLKRDYKSVHTDVQALLPIDLVQKGTDGLVFVPWDNILIDLHSSSHAA